MLGLVWIAAVILALSHRRRYPKVSQLTLTAIVIFFAESLASVCANIYLPFALPDASRPYILSFFYSLTGLISSVIQAVAWSFLIAAIFSQREKV